MKFELTILGANSAIPTDDRFPSSQVLNVQENLYLIDCGEGTQIQLSNFHIKRSKINQIFISHLHGDHIYGIFGLLTSFNHFGRTNPLEIFCPAGLDEVVQKILDLANAKLSYPLKFIDLNTTVYQKIFEDEVLEVFSIPLKHRIPTSGFLFKEKAHLRNIRPDAIDEYNLQTKQIQQAKRGNNIQLDNGRTIRNEEICYPPKKRRTYAYCSDTIYDEKIIPWITKVDMLYHETTYTHDLAEKARERMHATAKEAALIASKANVGVLITGHYSSRYKDLTEIIEEAKSIFPHSLLGREGQKYSVEFSPKKLEIN
jgi:ribonuclease Z